MNKEKVGIREATSKGYIECEIGGIADFSYPSSDTRRGRVQGGGNICPALTAQNMGICRIEKVIGGGVLEKCSLMILYVGEGYKNTKHQEKTAYHHPLLLQWAWVEVKHQFLQYQKGEKKWVK